MELILLADLIEAQEALRIGLVNRMVPAEHEKRLPRSTGRAGAS